MISGCAFLHCKKGTKADLNTVRQELFRFWGPVPSTARTDHDGPTTSGPHRAHPHQLTSEGSAVEEETRRRRSRVKDEAKKAERDDAHARTVYTPILREPAPLQITETPE